MTDATRDLKAIFVVRRTGAPVNLFAQFTLPTPSGFRDLPAEFTIRRTASPIELFAKFELQKSVDLPAEVVIRHTASENLFAELIVSHDLDVELFSKLVVRHTGTPLNLYAKFLPRAELTSDLKATFEVGQDSEDLRALMLINGFGNIIKGDTARELSQGFVFGSKFTMGPNQSVGDHIYFWFSEDTLLNYARGAIYTVSGNRPGTLIEETSLSAVLTGTGWQRVSFVERPILAAGVEYFLLVWINAAPGAEVRYTIPDSTIRGYTKGMGYASVGTFADLDPMPGGSERTYNFSIYATYDPATDASQDLKAVFEVGQNSVDLKAEFVVAQGTADLKAVFRMGQDTEDLKAEFTVTNADTYDLFAEFVVARAATKDLYAKFIVNQDQSADLFCVFKIYQPYTNLYAKLFVVNTTSKDLYAKTTIRQPGSQDLAAEVFIVRPVAEDLKAEFTVRRSTTKDLKAEFQLQRYEDLKAILYIPTRRNANAYTPIALDSLRYWMNYIHVAGKGFIGFPEFEDDNVDYAVPPNSLKISADRVEKGYKEFTFGWLYEGVDLRYWETAPCVDGKEFTLLASENWHDFVETTIDDDAIQRDNTLKMKWLRDYGAGGLYLVNDNYGSQNWLKCSWYRGYMPGDLTFQWHYWWSIIAMKWNLDGFSSINLDKFAWARIELYRYDQDGSIKGGALRTWRMPDCDDIDTRGGAGLLPQYGGCNTQNHTSTGRGRSGVWQELTSNFWYMGNQNMAFPQPPYPSYQVGNESFYAEPSGYGFTWDEDTWDKIDLTELMYGWLKGTYNNHGLFVTMDDDTSGFDYRQFDNDIHYYSRDTAHSEKPVIRIMSYPDNLKWTFATRYNQNTYWEINRDDPYSGTASLRLKDWSKRTYQKTILGAIHEGRPSITLNDHTPIEGYIDTAFRLNSESWTKLNNVPPPGPGTIDELTPTDNYFNVYFRYQDADNHYRVEFNKQGTACQVVLRLNGSDIPLGNTFLGRFKVGEWYKIRVTFVLASNGDLRICCYKFSDDNNRWGLLASRTDTSPSFTSGGSIYMETLDADLDETDVWRVQ